ncbi:unnamed protein product [Clonostachys byssicola]|uniref:Uncharacterized protein n=1 Tax=Clonostachys byssicola TaxID=160290 RepID=A0A9N9UJL2_9HYPO|nr:unnamed protein product [Clonostachys byssicola]
MRTSILSALPLLMLAKLAAAGCETHTYGTCEDNIVHLYDPNTGEICDPLDCGGGRAPVKYNVPGCAAYTGTETRKTEPSYMPCFSKTAGVGKAASTLATVSSAQTTTAASETTTASSIASSTSVESTSTQPTSTVAESSSTSASTSASSSAATTPLTTPAPVPSTTNAGPSNGTISATSTFVPPNAGNNMRGSVAGVLAVAFAAAAFI